MALKPSTQYRIADRRVVTIVDWDRNVIWEDVMVCEGLNGGDE
jgi:hypothetical protein